MHRLTHNSLKLHRLDAACDFGAKTREKSFDIHHDKFLAADEDFGFSAVDGSYDDLCGPVGAHSAILAGIHLSVGFSALVKGTKRNICPDTAGTYDGHADSFIIILGMEGFEESVKR